MEARPDKLDLAKADKSYYSAGGEPQLIALDAKLYLSLEGAGSPDGQSFADAVESLYTVAYAVKGAAKAAQRDFTVPKLEGLWWVAGGGDGLQVPRELWQWKLLIRMPEFVGADMAEQARERAAGKKKELEPIRRVRYEAIREGECVQAMHIGPYSAEPETLARMYAFMSAHGLEMNGRHHEIYLSDPRRGDSARMRTILRYPVRRRL